MADNYERKTKCMLKNYLKTAWRSFRKNRILSVINLGGLSIGTAAVLLIGIYIYSETGYDDFQQSKSSLYRVGFHFWQNGKSIGEGAEFTPPFGRDAKNEFPEIRSFIRISSERTSYITFNDKVRKIDNILHADSNFFQTLKQNLCLKTISK